VTKLLPITYYPIRLDIILVLVYSVRLIVIYILEIKLLFIYSFIYLLYCKLEIGVVWWVDFGNLMWKLLMEKN
jgi:hypothetical protein